MIAGLIIVAVIAVATFIGGLIVILRGNSPEVSEDIRGIPDNELPTLTNDQLICVALARLYEGEMLDDEVLIEELYRRGGRVKNRRANPSSTP